MTAETTAGAVAVSASCRAEITIFARHLLPETERRHAQQVTVTAAHLLAWALEARDEDDLLNRVRALRQQDANTPPVLRIAPDLPRRWVEMPALTVSEFLAEAAILYGFISAGTK